MSRPRIPRKHGRMNRSESTDTISRVGKQQLVAIIATTVALACRLALDSSLGDHLPYVTFFVAIAFTTWYAGLVASLTAVLLSGLAAVWFFIPPRHSLAIDDPFQLVGLLTYGAASLTVIAFGHVMNRARKRAQELAQGLRETEERLSLAQQVSQIGVFDWNLQTGINTWSRELYAIYGLAPEQFGNTREAWERCLHPEDREQMIQAVERSRISGNAEDREFRIVRPNGETRWLAGRWRWVNDEEGRPVRLTGVNFDITERKRIDQTAREHEVRARVDRQQSERATAHLAAIVKSSDDAIISKDLSGTVMSWNQAAERMFGYRAEEMIGQPILKLIPPDRQNEERDILEKIASGEMIKTYETVRRRKDGTHFHVSLTISPLFDGQGRVIGASKIARDVTEQKRAQDLLRDRERALTAANDELNQQKAGLAEVNRELQGFSYSVSHDLRAPLRTIDAYVRIVEEDHGSDLNDEVRRCLGIVKKAAGQAGELIDDLLEFSRLGRVGMDMRPTEMTALAREVAEELALTEGQRTIDLTIRDLPSCHGDWRLLKLVWANLLSNAFKFTRSRALPQIEVGWLPDDRQPDASVYYVKDNGVGFDMKYVHKLFTVFQRLHLKDEFEGTGVGLAIVHRIVQRHGGRVWAEGKIDGGATFFFSLRKAVR
jgi:PAS domain S-box-containing protein